MPPCEVIPEKKEHSCLPSHIGEFFTLKVMFSESAHFISAQ